MNIQLLTDELSESYERFLRKQKGALLYYSLPFKSFLQAILNCEAHYFVALLEGEIVGVLPAMSCTGPKGVVVNSLPFFGSHGGPLADHPEAVRRLIEAYEDFELDRPLASRVLVENPFAPLVGPVAHNLMDERISQATPLPAGDSLREALFETIDASARRNIRKAERLGIEVRIDNSAMEFLFRTHVANMASIGGLAKERIFFDRIPQYFEPGRDFAIYVAELEGEPIAALLVFYFVDTVEYFTPVILDDYRGHQPLALILLTAMQDAAKQGFRKWNWGGTWNSQTGVWRFKQKWGAIQSRYRYFVQLKNDEILSESPDTLRESYPGFYVVPYSALKCVA